MGVAILQYSTDRSTAWSSKASRATEVESRTTRKLERSCSGVLCVTRQRLVTKIAAVAWRHSVMFASCYGRLYEVNGDFVFVVLLEILYSC